MGRRFPILSFPFLSFPFEALHEDNGVRMYVVYTVVSYYYSTQSSNVTVSGTHTHSAILIAMVAPIIVIPCCCCWLLLRDFPSPRVCFLPIVLPPFPNSAFPMWCRIPVCPLLLLAPRGVCRSVSRMIS